VLEDQQRKIGRLLWVHPDPIDWRAKIQDDLAVLFADRELDCALVSLG